jgi:hypothetical protein
MKKHLHMCVQHLIRKIDVSRSVDEIQDVVFAFVFVVHSARAKKSHTDTRGLPRVASQTESSLLMHVCVYAWVSIVSGEKKSVALLSVSIPCGLQLDCDATLSFDFHLLHAHISKSALASELRPCGLSGWPSFQEIFSCLQISHCFVAHKQGKTSVGNTNLHTVSPYNEQEAS